MSRYNKFLLAAIFCSVLIRIAYVIIPPLSFDLPRMGDDSLVYLFKAKHHFLDGAKKHQAIENLKTSLLRNKDPNMKWIRDRLSMRAIGIFSPVYELFSAMLLKIQIPLKYAFLINELIILLIYTLTTTSLIYVLFSPRIAAYTILLTVFYPDRFVPTNLSAAFGFGLWALSFISIKPSIKKTLEGTLILLSLLSHQIGLIFVVIYICLEFFKNKKISNVLILLTWIVISKLVQRYCFWWIEMLPTSGTGHLTFEIKEILRNFLALRSFVSKDPLLLLCIISSLGGAYSLFKRARGQCSIFFYGLITAALISSSIFLLPGYYGELSERILVICFPIYAAFTVYFFKSLYFNFSQKKIIIITIAILVSYCWMISGKRYTDIVFMNINERNILVHEKNFNKRIQEIPDNVPILVTENDIIYKSALISNSNKNLFPLNILSKEFALGAEELFLLAPIPEKLNTLAYMRSKRLDYRKYAFWLKKSQVLLKFHDHDSIFLKFSNEATDVDVTCLSGKISIKKIGNTVSVLCPPMAGQSIIKVQGGKKAHWLEGISFSAATSLHWPWGEESLEIHYSCKNYSFNMNFSSGEILGKKLITYFNNYSQISYLSDDSGVLFMRLSN